MTAESEGAVAEVDTTLGDGERFANMDEMVLGVDTHLDLHMTVALDKLGSVRPLSVERSGANLLLIALTRYQRRIGYHDKDSIKMLAAGNGLDWG